MIVRGSADDAAWPRFRDAGCRLIRIEAHSLLPRSSRLSHAGRVRRCGEIFRSLVFIDARIQVPISRRARHLNEDFTFPIHEALLRPPL